MGQAAIRPPSDSVLRRARWPAGAAVGAALGLVAVWMPPAELAAQRPAPGATGTLWISDSPAEDGRRLLVVIDQSTRHAAVYHVETASGGLTLKSTRDISCDLMVGDFNAREPKPATLRKMLQAGQPSPETAR